MTSGVTVHMPARDQKDGLTLGELALFVERCRTAGVRDDARITAQINWRATVKEVGIRL